MNVIVLMLIAFLLGVAARACWLMVFPLSMPLVGATSDLTLADLTFRTLMSMLWTGGAAALIVGAVCSGVGLLQRLNHKRTRKAQAR